MHERTVAELFAAASGPASTISKLDEEARIALLRENCVSPRPLVLARFMSYGEETAGGARRSSPQGGEDSPQDLRPGRHPHQHHLELRRRLRHAGARAAAERGWPVSAPTAARRHQHGPAVRDDRRPAQLRRRDGPPARAAGISGQVSSTISAASRR